MKATHADIRPFFLTNRFDLGHGVEALYEVELLVLDVLLGRVHLLPQRRPPDGLRARRRRPRPPDSGLLQPHPLLLQLDQPLLKSSMEHEAYDDVDVIVLFRLITNCKLMLQNTYYKLQSCMPKRHYKNAIQSTRKK